MGQINFNSFILLLIESPQIHIPNGVDLLKLCFKNYFIIGQIYYWLRPWPADCEEEEAVAEWDGGGTPPGHRYTNTHHMSQVPEKS